MCHHKFVESFKQHRTENFVILFHFLSFNLGKSLLSNLGYFYYFITYQDLLSDDLNFSKYATLAAQETPFIRVSMELSIHEKIVLDYVTSC